MDECIDLVLVVGCPQLSSSRRPLLHSSPPQPTLNLPGLSHSGPPQPTLNASAEPVVGVGGRLGEQDQEHELAVVWVHW